MNNNYLKRHEESLKSSELLIHSHAHYSNSVHCAYYSVFQYMLHFHKVRGLRTFRDRDKLARNGSHDQIISATFDNLFELDRSKGGLFNREMSKLKSERVIADYTEYHIDRTRSIAALEMAKKLVNILSETLNTK
jgi:uncharacterized protein (UPF0332 family)